MTIDEVMAGLESGFEANGDRHAGVIVESLVNRLAGENDND